MSVPVMNVHQSPPRPHRLDCPGAGNGCTLWNGLSPAQTCRDRGWANDIDKLSGLMRAVLALIRSEHPSLDTEQMRRLRDAWFDLPAAQKALAEER